MAHSGSTPAARPPLFVVPAVTEPVSRNAGRRPVTEPVTAPVTLPLTPLTVTGNAGERTGGPAASNTPGAVVPMTAPERARLAVREVWRPYARFLRMLWHGKPESMAEHRAYIKSRRWVPEGVDGKARKVLVFLGVAYHLWIGRPLKAAAKTLDGSADRPLRLAGLIALLIVFTVFVLPHIPLI